MADFALAGAGAFVFALTTWASLTFGYQVFQDMWETDQAADAAPDVQLTTDDHAVPVLAGRATDGGVTHATGSPPPVTRGLLIRTAPGDPSGATT